MRVLYVTGTDEGEELTPVLRELSWLEPGLEVKSVAGGSAALVEIRTGDLFGAVFISPALPHNEALALIATLRRDEVPLAIVVVITESQRHFFAPAITAGADDVLVASADGLIAPESTLHRVRHSRYVDPAGSQSPLKVVYIGEDDAPWHVLTDTSFVEAGRAEPAADGACLLEIRRDDGSAAPADVVVVDDHTGEAHALQVVKWIHAFAPTLPVIVLSSPAGGDIGSAAIELGADDVVLKTPSLRKRLLASLHRLYQRAIRTNGAAVPAGIAQPQPGRSFRHPDDLEGPVQAEAAEPAELAILRAALSATEDRLAEATSALADAEVSLATRERECEDLRRQVEQIERAPAPTAVAPEDLRGPLQAVEAERDRLHDDLERLVRERDDVKGAHEALRQAHGALELRLAELQREVEELREARGFGDAMRERDREELTRLQRTAAEERERRLVLEQTLRHTEDQARAEVAAAEARHVLARRELEARLADAADRLHAVAGETQVLQSGLEHAMAEGSAERARVIAGLRLGHAVVTERGELVRCNDTFAAMFGFASAAEAVDRWAGAPFEGLPDHTRLMAAIGADGGTAQIESTARHTSGRPFRVRTAATWLIASAGARPMVERICLDLSDRQQLEAQLRFARRLEAAGRLAVEMGRDLEPLLDRLDAADHGPDSTERRIAVLARQLLAFGRRQAKPAGYLSLNDLIRRQEAPLRQVLADAVTIEFDLREVDTVAAGEDDLSSLVSTLVHAAVACLPYGGTVRVATASSAEALVVETQLSVTAVGYGAQSSSLVPSLERLASRCGGTFRTSGDADRSITLHVSFPC